MKVDKDPLIFVGWNISRAGATVGHTTRAKFDFIESKQCSETQKVNNKCR